MEPSDGLPGTANLPFVEELYTRWCDDPRSVSEAWRDRFAAWSNGDAGRGRAVASAGFTPRGLFDPHPSADGAEGSAARLSVLQDRVDQFIRAYRVRGHNVARIDPLGRPRPGMPELEPSYYGFADSDLDRTFSVDTMPGAGMRTLRSILEHLRDTYCRNIGVQYMHIDEVGVRAWLRERMEATKNRLTLTHDEQLTILHSLTEAVVFEEFVQKKFIGAKSFSLEGAETLIPLLRSAIEAAGDFGTDEIVLAMAHRGRLNVLANIMGKDPQQIFLEFEDKAALPGLGGDVKYHLGHSRDWVTRGGRTVHLSLCFNPSHLEYVNPVALGRTRAKQDRAGDVDRRRGMAILVHGDAAFIGEGVVQETLNLSELAAYETGGTLHIVVNNQIGFTTPPESGRSSTYATDVAKMLQIPIFHVNGEDPEAVAQVVAVAMAFRFEFHRDVVIDMYCYRRRGHNEIDEPTFTQPVMYRTIHGSESVREGYLRHMLSLGGITPAEAEGVERQCREGLEARLAEVRGGTVAPKTDTLQRVWNGFVGGPATNAVEPDTAMERATLSELLSAQNRLPADFRLNPRLERLVKNRQEMADGSRPLDWGGAESLALAGLAAQGVRVRMSGQDSCRGTFSHRHAVLHDHEDGTRYMPLRHVAEGQAPVDIHDSPLSEIGVLGFEYGYSLDCPEGLVIWEAQFGDFINCAQVIIDQFLVSAEDKWNRLSGLVLLLPHGFEGQGPEHSSARIERFLMMAADDNIQVALPTTPAQLFHLLRRQALMKWKKPLIVMTPKSLLRHPRCISRLEDLAGGQFQKVLPEPDAGLDLKAVRRVLLCSGKIAHELFEERERRGRGDVAIVRLEQLYPLPEAELSAALHGLSRKAPVIHVQEEPENMGAWRYLRVRFPGRFFDRPFHGIHREASPSPAAGSAATHKAEQTDLYERAFAPDERLDSPTSEGTRP